MGTINIYRPPEKVTASTKEWLKKIGAGLALLLLSPLIIGLAPIWIPLNWLVERGYARDMARPRGCLTYQMTEEQLEYFEAHIAREREEKAQTPG